MGEFKMLYLGIAVWPNWEKAKKIMWIFLKSVERGGFDFKYYGLGISHWPGYRGQKVNVQLDWLCNPKNTEGYTHVLYTDCCDVLMFGTPQEIEDKYTAIGRPPILVSTSHQLANVSDKRYDGMWGGSRYCYPNCGGYIAEISLWVETMKRFLKDYPQHGDDCFMWYDGWVDGWFRPALDTSCEIFQVRDGENLEVVDGRLRNRITGSFPCVFHEAGGYFDPEVGKDASMIPWAKKVGLI